MLGVTMGVEVVGSVSVEVHTAQDTSDSDWEVFLPEYARAIRDHRNYRHNTVDNPWVVKRMTETGQDAPVDVLLGEQSTDEMCGFAVPLLVKIPNRDAVALRRLVASSASR